MRLLFFLIIYQEEGLIFCSKIRMCKYFKCPMKDEGDKKDLE